ncbi:MAG TPA: AsmA-like C-terminal region-containing protein [Candidatus Polarisedimenticolaceae bacterium]|nr:AsmA-like C-terminal region-containing protein [Candidatus Polarisedimenticolaceae bacterium]
MRLRRPLLGCAAIALIVFVAAAIVLPRLVDADALRARAEAELSKSLGRKVSLGTTRLTLWTGLALSADKFRVGEPLSGSAAGVPLVEAGATSVHVAFLPLLHREVDAKSITVEHAAILRDGKPLLSDLSLSSTLHLAPDGSIDAAGKATAKVDLLPAKPTLDARFAVAFANGALAIRSADAEIAGAHVGAQGTIDGVSTPQPHAKLDLSADLGKSKLSGPLDATFGPQPAGRFDLHADRLDLAELADFPSKLAGTAPPAVPSGVAMTAVHAVMTMNAGEVRLDDASFQAFGGEGRGTVSAHPFDAERAFAVDQAVSRVSIGALIAALAPAQKGSVEGTAALKVALHGRAGEKALLPTVSGPGHVEITNGTIKSVGVIQQVMKLLEVAGAKGIAKSDTPFDRLSADFDVVSGTATTKNLEFRSADLDADGAGTVGLGGALHLDVLGSFSKAVSDQLVAKTPALSIRVNGEGRLTVPLQIRGTAQAPKVQLDVDKVLREGVVKELKKEGTKNLLKKLFGGK